MNTPTVSHNTFAATYKYFQTKSLYIEIKDLGLRYVYHNICSTGIFIDIVIFHVKKPPVHANCTYMQLVY